MLQPRHLAQDLVLRGQVPHGVGVITAAASMSLPPGCIYTVAISILSGLVHNGL